MKSESEFGSVNVAHEADEVSQVGERSGFARLVSVTGFTASLAMAALGCVKKTVLPESPGVSSASQGFEQIQPQQDGAKALLASAGDKVTINGSTAGNLDEFAFAQHVYPKMEIDHEQCDIVTSDVFRGDTKFMMYMGVDCPEQDKYYNVYDICYGPRYKEEDRGYAVASCTGSHVVRRWEGIRFGNYNRTFKTK